MKRILPVMKVITIAVFCTLLLNACYLGKTIEKQVTVFLDLSEFKVSTMDHTSNIQYLNYATEQEYRTAFLNSLSNEATYSKNVTIVYTQPADYTLKLTYFEIKESESKETVNDASSPYNGQSYFLSSVDTKASFDLMKGTDKIDSYTAYADKSEKLKNNQSLGQLIIGANKDNTQYREKLMQEDICKDLSDKCGRRTWNLFTQKLAKKMK